MSTKRKDNKGRILRTGESQRKDLIYQYRYIDPLGNRKTIYDSDLQSLRKKEKEITNALVQGVHYANGELTVLQLVEKYINLHTEVRYNTLACYNVVKRIIEKEAFSRQKICNVKVSDAKQWLVKLSKEGFSYNTVRCVRNVIKPAFQMAYEDYSISRNPFDFKLNIINNDSKKRVALSLKQQASFLKFVAEDKVYSKYLDDYVILLGTGLRVSEFAGLVLNDLDFENRKFKVERQLIKTPNGDYFVEKTKSDSGIRFIPMTDLVFQSFKNIINNRIVVKPEFVIDGYSGFLSLNKLGRPKIAENIEGQLRRAYLKYNKTHKEQLPNISPHVFRHTFCTNMINAGVDVKSVQYLMGHSSVNMTLDIYTHTDSDKVANEMLKASDKCNPFLNES